MECAAKKSPSISSAAPPTVEWYVRQLLGKFGARSRVHLIACALRLGTISFDDVELGYPYGFIHQAVLG
jgi:hypothetical protein